MLKRNEFRHDRGGIRADVAGYFKRLLKPAEFRSIVKRQFAQKRFDDILRTIERDQQPFLEDSTLAKMALWSFGASNDMEGFELFGKALVQTNPDSARIINYVLAHQMRIFNSGRFWQALREVLIVQYSLEDGLDWKAIYSAIRAIAERHVAAMDDERIAAAFAGSKVLISDARAVAIRHFMAIEFFYFYDNLRVHMSFGRRFAKEPIATLEDGFFRDQIVNLGDFSSRVAEVSEAGPNLFILLHCSFNMLVASVARSALKNTRFIGRSMYPPTEDDGFMLYFQSDKASRLRVFAQAMKHMAKGGNLMISPDGIAGNDPGPVKIFGMEFEALAGAPTLAFEMKAPTYMLQPELSEEGIHLRIIKLRDAEAGVDRMGFIESWRRALSEALEEMFDNAETLPVYNLNIARAWAW